MTRPCFLVVDREYMGSISTRKLVIETAKLNVITAYSGAEAQATLERFPKIDAIVLDTGIRDVPCEELVRRLKATRDIPVVAIGVPQVGQCRGADYFFEGFEPAKLLEVLQQIAPDTARIKEWEKAGAPTG